MEDRKNFAAELAVFELARICRGHVATLGVDELIELINYRSGELARLNAELSSISYEMDEGYDRADEINRSIRWGLDEELFGMYVEKLKGAWQSVRDLRPEPVEPLVEMVWCEASHRTLHGNTLLEVNPRDGFTFLRRGNVPLEPSRDAHAALLWGAGMDDRLREQVRDEVVRVHPYTPSNLIDELFELIGER